MSKFDELKAAAEIAEPIFTDLYGDRYMQGSWSRVDLTQTQDAFVALATPAAILELLAIQAQLVEALKGMNGIWDMTCDSHGWERNHMQQRIDSCVALAAAGAQP